MKPTSNICHYSFIETSEDRRQFYEFNEKRLCVQTGFLGDKKGFFKPDTGATEKNEFYPYEISHLI